MLSDATVASPLRTPASQTPVKPGQAAQAERAEKANTQAATPPPFAQEAVDLSALAKPDQPLNTRQQSDGSGLASLELVEDYSAAFQAWSEANREAGSIWANDRTEEALKAFEELYDRIEKTEPVAARVLDTEEAEEARRRFEGVEPNIQSENGLVAFISEGLRYNFEPDGQVTVNAQGVPTSEQQKQSWLESLRETLKGSDDGLREGERKTLAEQASQKATDAVARMGALENAYGIGGFSGSITDTTA
ncbi:hypothetical protein JM93_00943 [Roseibium hamelinense]|uniref:Uncharacterized protein n=1 Tax=Roseibium hamelinense TaxID=150831 RepID=A0A562TI93_9HYPH|nr:hypothetical protein [Roseibium hamelinense]MTI42741.1 hypothetical protein [Roseibium hamelinense]TWI93387.1 hypothetical protein JM93_00943 [Roseibium hamelinense]